MMSPICSLLRTVLIVIRAVLRSLQHRMLDLLLLLRLYYTRLYPLLAHSTNVHAAQNYTTLILVLARRKTVDDVRAYHMAEILRFEILILQVFLMHRTRAETDGTEHLYGKRRRATRAEVSILVFKSMGIRWWNEGFLGGHACYMNA
jgi:hypothetical protein